MIVSIHPNLIKCIQDRGLTRDFADFLYMKYMYSNSCMFEYNKLSASRKTGFSRTKINRLVSLFISKGWCKLRQEKGYVNLLFLELHEIHKYFIDKVSPVKRERLVIKQNNSKLIFQQLNRVLLKIRLSQMQYIINLKKDLHNPAGKFARQDHQRAVRISRKLQSDLSGEISEDLRLSNAAFGKYLGQSSSTAGRVLKELVMQGLICCTKNCRLLIRNASVKLLQELTRLSGRANLYLWRGDLYLRLSNSYTLVPAQAG